MSPGNLSVEEGWEQVRNQTFRMIRYGASSITIPALLSTTRGPVLILLRDAPEITQPRIARPDAQRPGP